MPTNTHVSVWLVKRVLWGRGSGFCACIQQNDRNNGTRALPFVDPGGGAGCSACGRLRWVCSGLNAHGRTSILVTFVGQTDASARRIDVDALITLVVTNFFSPREGVVPRIPTVVQTGSIIRKGHAAAGRERVAVVDDHSFKDNVRGVYLHVDRRLICTRFIRQESSGTNRPRFRFTVSVCRALHHRSQHFLASFHADAFAAMRSTVAVDEIRAQMPLIPKQWIENAAAFTELQHGLEDQAGVSVLASAVLETVENIYRGQSGRSSRCGPVRYRPHRFESVKRGEISLQRTHLRGRYGIHAPVGVVLQREGRKGTRFYANIIEFRETTGKRSDLDDGFLRMMMNTFLMIIKAVRHLIIRIGYVVNVYHTMFCVDDVPQHCRKKNICRNPHIVCLYSSTLDAITPRSRSVFGGRIATSTSPFLRSGN